MKLGRLFWKFFLFFWLAQVLTSVGVGVTIWWLRPEAAGRAASFSPPTLVQPAPYPPRHALGPPGPHGPPGWWSPRPLRSPWIPLLAGGVVSLGFAALLAWYFARPIGRLRSAFEAVADGRLDTRVGPSMGSRRDELADLGQDFDRMAGRLQNLVQGQQRLLHDVSHELRSPLARLQAAADLLRQQPERSAELIERIGRDTARMDRLVGELLTLARLDAGTAGRLDERVDLEELLAGITTDARFEAQAVPCSVEMSVPAGLTVRGNGELLHRAVENVVRNALRHSPASGRVDIVACRADDNITITVDDQGPGVTAAELETIFQPFVRGTGAKQGTGFGLGLALTRRIVHAHGGTVHASNRADGGLRVTLQLPA